MPVATGIRCAESVPPASTARTMAARAASRLARGGTTSSVNGRDHPRDDHRVVTERVPVAVHGPAVDGQRGGDVVPRVRIQADARDSAQLLGQRRDQAGRLGIDVTGTRPPRAIERPRARPRRLRTQQNRNRSCRLAEPIRQERRVRRVAVLRHGPPPICRPPGRAHSPGGRRRGHRASEPPRCPHRTPSGRRTLQPDRVGVASLAPAAIRAGPHRPDQQPRYFGPLLADSARASQNVATSSSGSPPWWASAAPRPGTGPAGRRSSTAPQATSTAAVRSPEQRRRLPRIDHPVLPARQVDAKVGAADGHGGGQAGKEMVGAGEDRTGSRGRGRRRRRPAAG